MDTPFNSSTGTIQAVQGAMDRVATPHLFDAIFPVFAFIMVILVPAALASFVIYKTIKETNKNADEI